MNLTRAISVSHCSERKKAYLIWDLQGRYSKKSCAQISSSFLLAQKQRVICMSVCIEITRGSTAHTKPKCFKNTQEILNYKSFIEHLNLYLLHRMLLFVYPFLRTLSLPLKSKPLLPKLLSSSCQCCCSLQDILHNFTINNSTKLLSEKKNVYWMDKLRV